MLFCTPGSCLSIIPFESPGDQVRVLGAGAPDEPSPGDSEPQASRKGFFFLPLAPTRVLGPDGGGAARAAGMKVRPGEESTGWTGWGTARVSPHHLHSFSRHPSRTYYVPGSVMRVAEMNKP